MRRMKLLALTALLMTTGSCALDFGSPPDPLDAPGTVDSTDPDSVSPDVGDDTLPTPGACDPILEWTQNEAWIDFANLVDFEVVGPPSDNYGIQEIAGETALVIQDESLDILVHEVHAQDPDRFTLRFYVPLGAVARAWPWFATPDKDKPEARTGVFVGLTAETASDQKIILGVAPFQQPLEVTTRYADMADRWLEVDLQIFPDEGRVTALFRGFDEGDESPSEERTEFLELFSVDLYGPLNSGNALFSAGQPEGSDWPGTGKGVAWKTAHQSTLTSRRPYDADQCPVCEWHKVWTNNESEFDEDQCVCVEAATPEGGLSSDPGVTYCPPEEVDNEACEWTDENQAMMPYECTLVDPDEVGGFEGCYSWSPKDDWEGCDPHVTDEAWGECVSRTCVHWLEGNEGNKVQRVHCAFEPTTEDICTCLEPAPPEISEAFACDPGANDEARHDVFKPAMIDGKAYCGPCRDAGNGCGFAHLAPCAGNGVCLEATCNPAQGCVIEDSPNGEPCDDEDDETPYSHCQEGACVPAGAPACDPAPCDLVGDCDAQAHTFKAGDLDLLGAWMGPDGRAFVTGGHSLFIVDPTQPPPPNAVQGVDSPTGENGGGPLDLHAVTGNDLGELFLATKSGLFVSDISAPGQWSWAPATVYSDWYNDVWSGTGVEGAPVFAVGKNALTARRYSGKAWLGWQSDHDHYWGPDAIFTSVHGSSEEHIKVTVTGQNGAGTSFLGSITLIDGESHTDDVSSYVLDALGMGEDDLYHFSGVWGADDHHFYVVTSGGHLAHYTPISQEEFWSGSWSKIDLPDEGMGQSWSFMAISGARVDGETHLVLVGEEGLVVEHVVDTDEWTVRVAPIAGVPQWNDVHMAPDGSYVAVGEAGAGGGDSNEDNVFIWQETGACTTICPDGQEWPEADGCHINNVEAGEGGCAAIYAPHGALCDDGLDETSGDHCVPNPDGPDDTLCQGATLPCVKVSDAFGSDFSCVEEVVGDDPYCKLQYASPGAECTDWFGATKDDKCELVFDEGEMTVCSGTPIECPTEPPEKEPCFSYWEPSDGSLYEPEEGDTVEDCAIVHRPAGSGCDDGSHDTSDDICADDGSCNGSTDAELEVLIDYACEPFGSGYLKCKGIQREWSDAQAFCQSQGMGLVVLENQLENDMTNASFNDGKEEDSSFWIGLQDLEEEGTFVWSDGVTWKDDGSTPDVFSSFALGEPNDSTGNENCVESGSSWAADQSTEGFMKGWNDLPCSALESFVCEAPAACGDGKLSDHLEECDDGNNDLGDGCGPDCQHEVAGQDYCDAVKDQCPWILSATYDPSNEGEVPSDFCDLALYEGPCIKSVTVNPAEGVCEIDYHFEGFVCDEENWTNGCLGVDICAAWGECMTVGPLDCESQAGPCENFGCTDNDGLDDDGCNFSLMKEGSPCDDGDPSTSGETCDDTGTCAPPALCVDDGCIAAGYDHTCALDSAGEAVCWGTDVYGESTPPPGPFTAIVAGYHYTCALDPDGEAVCWGLDIWGQTDPPDGPFTTIAAGYYHACALDLDHVAHCWGMNDNGQTDPPELLFFTDIAAGYFHTCGFDEAGVAHCWGSDAEGQSSPAYTNWASSEPEAGACAALRIVEQDGAWYGKGCEESHPYICEVSQTTGGFNDIPPACTVMSVGASSYLFCENSSTYSSAKGACSASGGDLVTVEDATESQWLATTAESLEINNGTNVAWIGLTEWEGSWVWSDGTPLVGGPFTDITAGHDHTCALDGLGDAICWGLNDFGESASKAGPFTAITAGWDHNCALDEAGEAHCWGWDLYGQTTVPEGPFTAIAAGYRHTCALNAAGEASCWGSDGEGQSTVPTEIGCAAAVFDGSSSYVRSTETFGEIRGGATELTFEAWVRPANENPNGEHILSTSCNMVSVRVPSGGKLKGHVWPNNCAGSTTLEAGIWYHISLAFSVDGGGGTLYLNGQEECSIESGAGLNSGGSPVDNEFLYIGALSDNCGGALPQTVEKNWAGDIAGVKLSEGFGAGTGYGPPGSPESTRLFYDFEDGGKSGFIEDLSMWNHDAIFEALNWSTNPEHCVLAVTCGNGEIDLGETCDDGNMLAGDGCYECQTECSIIGSGEVFDFTPMESGTTAGLEGVWGTSESNVYAVGAGGTILHYDGMVWSEMASNESQLLLTVWGSGPSDIYVGGSAGALTHYDGEDWSHDSGAISVNTISIWGSSASNVYQVGWEWTMKNGSLGNWTSVPLSIPAPGTEANQLIDIHGLASDDVHAVGVGGSILHFDGSVWESVNSGTNEHLHGVWAAAPDQVFVVGESATVLQYSGGDWSAMESNTTGHLSEVTGLAADDVYAVGYISNPQGFILHYDGSAWSEIPGVSTVRLNDLWIDPAGTVAYAVGNDGTILRGSCPN